MERAQRAADSPMRAILEAAKLRRRGEGETTEADANARRPNGPRGPASEGSRPDLQRTPITAANGVAANGAGSGPASGPANGAAVPPPAPRSALGAAGSDATVITIRTLEDDALPAAPARSAALATSAVAPLRGASAPALPVELPRLAPWAVSVAGALQPPELVHMVEPEMTPRLQELLSRPEVAVEFTILPDGRVSGVHVVPPVHRALVPVIASAVEQWRYAPVPVPRPHRVQLVFKSGAN